VGESIRNSTLAVGTDSVLVSEALIGNAQRKILTITNVSGAAQVIYLSFGDEARVGYGIPIWPTGAWSESMDSAFLPTNERVFAVASAAAGAIAIHERILSRD
jgi:hypothetical protein